MGFHVLVPRPGGLLVVRYVARSAGCGLQFTAVDVLSDGPTGELPLQDPHRLPPLLLALFASQAFDPQTFMFKVGNSTGENARFLNGPRLERLAGKESQKKWRQSVRVLEGKFAGRTIGEYIDGRELQPAAGASGDVSDDEKAPRHRRAKASRRFGS